MMIATRNGKVAVWHLATGRVITDLEPGSEAFFDPVSRQVAAASGSDRVAAILDGVPTVVDLARQTLGRRSCKLAGFGFTAAEWRVHDIELPYEDLCAIHRH